MGGIGEIRKTGCNDATPEAGQKRWIKQIIDEETTIFNDKLKKADQSRTTAGTDKYGHKVEYYHDKEGNLLYSKTEISKDNIYHYEYKNENTTVILHDNDNDNKMDSMSYYVKQTKHFQANSTNDDGNFDEASVHYGKFAGKNLDIKN